MEAQVSQLILQAGGVGDLADSLLSKLGSLVVLFVVLGAFALLFRVGANRYKKVPPDQALVVYGGGNWRQLRTPPQCGPHRTSEARDERRDDSRTHIEQPLR